MNPCSRPRASRALVLMAALAAFGPAGQAQSIEVSKDRSAPATQALPFAPAPVKAPAPPAAPPKPVYVLGTDQPVHEGLKAWAKAQDWELRWYPAVSWRVIREADFSSAPDLGAAVSEVVDILRDEGKPIKLRISEGNRIMEVMSTEVSQ
jgi:hypothetical protein